MLLSEQEILRRQKREVNIKLAFRRKKKDKSKQEEEDVQKLEDVER